MSEREPPRPGEPEPSPPQPEPPVPQPGEPEPATPPPEPLPPRPKLYAAPTLLTREPFWGWGDLAVVAGLFLPCLLGGMLVVRVFLALFRIHTDNELVRLLPAQFLGYLFLFFLMKMLFHQQYGAPFWRSLGWVRGGPGPGVDFTLGMVLAIAVAALSVAIKTPVDPNSPMNKLLADRASVILMGVVGITVGPLCEELIFRGFLQPLLARSLGAALGVLLAGFAFGLVHLQEYGFSWRHGLLIGMAGAGFGWMRQRTGSTRASTIMHAGYNATFFLALVLQRKELPHSW